MISDTVNMLLERMKTNPDEFVNKDWDPVEHGAWTFEPFEDVRWGNLLKSVFQTGKEHLFTDEELAAIKETYGEMLRARCQECIIKELISGEAEKEIAFKAKQMELDLPYTTMSAKMTASLGQSIVQTKKDMLASLNTAFDTEYKK